MDIFSKVRSAYLPFRDFSAQLQEEIDLPLGSFGNLLLSAAPATNKIWAQNAWTSPKLIPFTSIGDAAKQLTAIQPLWYPYIHQHARRSQLICAKLPYISAKPVDFTKRFPTSKLGSFTLINENLMLASAECTSPRANGQWEFCEDKINPPNRAYLKLWEVFSRLNIRPKPQSICLEIGAAPGGWSWVLAPFCKKLITYDRAPLAANIAAMPQIEHHLGNAFSALPDIYPEVDWIFSDIICYPPKLFEWVEKWLNDEKKRNFVCTIKLQERTHYEWIERFAQIEGSTVLHLYHNKHELTWVCIQNPEAVEGIA